MGSLIGSNLVVSAAHGIMTDPVVVYDVTHQKYLVAWSDDRDLASTGYNIYGQIVNANGIVSSDSFTIRTPRAINLPLRWLSMPQPIRSWWHGRMIEWLVVGV